VVITGTGAALAHTGPPPGRRRAHVGQINGRAVQVLQQGQDVSEGWTRIVRRRGR
jgi:hypothetical protein